MDPTLQLRLASQDAVERATRSARRFATTLHMLLLLSSVLVATYDVWLLVRQ